MAKRRLTATPSTHCSLRSALQLEVSEIPRTQRRVLAAVWMGFGDEDQPIGLVIGKGAEEGRFEKTEDGGIQPRCRTE